MDAPSWFKKELELVHCKYFVIYDSQIKRWRIRKWICALPRWRTWQMDSENVKTICMEDETGRNVGYAPLDMRAIHALREGLYWARHARKLLQMVDEKNAKLYENANIEDDYIHHYGAKALWRHYQEAFVDIGGANVSNRT